MFGTEQFFKSQHMGLLCRDESCSVYQMRNETGDGVATFYPVYPGISVMYSDFHMTDCLRVALKKVASSIFIIVWRDAWSLKYLTAHISI